MDPHAFVDKKTEELTNYKKGYVYIKESVIQRVSKKSRGLSQELWEFIHQYNSQGFIDSFK